MSKRKFTILAALVCLTVAGGLLGFVIDFQPDNESIVDKEVEQARATAQMITSGFAYPEEMNELIERLFIANQKMSVYLNNPQGLSKKDRPKYPPNYWNKKYERAKSELLAKGYFVKKEGSIRSEKFKEFFFKMVENENSEKLLLCTTASCESEKPHRTIFIIGPPEVVDEALSNLKKMNEVGL